MNTVREIINSNLECFSFIVNHVPGSQRFQQLHVSGLCIHSDGIPRHSQLAALALPAPGSALPLSSQLQHPYLDHHQSGGNTAPAYVLFPGHPGCGWHGSGYHHHAQDFDHLVVQCKDHQSPWVLCTVVCHTQFCRNGIRHFCLHGYR